MPEVLLAGDGRGPAAVPPIASSVLRCVPASALADIAARLAASARSWDDRLELDPTRRTGLRLLSNLEYDVWLLRWPPFTTVKPHDHGRSAGAFSVAAGQLYEVRWCSATRRGRHVGAGETVTISEGVVHDVRAGRSVALSVHAYSPPLTTMGFYDQRGQAVVGRKAVEVSGPAGVWSQPAQSVGES